MHMCRCAKKLQLCLTLYHPMDCSPPSSSVHGILQARILEWVAIPSSKESFQSRDQTHVSYASCISRLVLYHLHHLGSPKKNTYTYMYICVYIYIYIYTHTHIYIHTHTYRERFSTSLNHCEVHLKQIQHCKSTRLQF